MKNLTSQVFYQYINQIPQFVWWKDLNSTFLGCNKNVAEYFNLNSVDDIVGLTDYDLYNCKSDADFVISKDKEVISSGTPLLNFEECLDVPSIGKRWFSTSKVPLYDDKKNIIGTIGWFNDITEIKEMQLKLNKSNKALINYSAELKKANKKLGIANLDLESFAFAASHDLKTPVINIKGFSDLLLNEHKNNFSPEVLEKLNFINDSAKRMENLINGVLQYAKIGTQDLETHECDLSILIPKVIQDLKIKHPHANIVLDIPSSKIKVYKNLIGVVFTNLIQNGIKYNENNSPKIICTYHDNDAYHIFTIEDNGIGIEPGYEKYIFEPFKRLADQSNQGTGIGLTTCLKIINLHRGTIGVLDSKKGSTKIQFTILKNL